MTDTGTARKTETQAEEPIVTSSLTPREIVSELDRFIVGQDAARAENREALAAITHVDVAMFRRAREGAVLDADAVYTFSPMYAPRHPAACACDDCLDAELARLGTVLL